MDSSNIVTLLIALLGSSGLLGGMGWLFRRLLQNKDEQIARVQSDCEKQVKSLEKDRTDRIAGYEQRLTEKERECESYRQENKQLWQEKVVDARESADIAKAYIRLREREDG